MNNLTKKQEATVAFLRRYLAENDQFPTTRRLAKEFGIVQAAAMARLRALEIIGEIERNEANGWRFSRAGKEEVTR